MIILLLLGCVALFLGGYELNKGLFKRDRFLITMAILEGIVGVICLVSLVGRAVEYGVKL